MSSPALSSTLGAAADAYKKALVPVLAAVAVLTVVTMLLNSVLTLPSGFVMGSGMMRFGPRLMFMMFWSSLAMIVVHILGSMYYFVLFARGGKGIAKTMSAIPPVFLPLLGVYVWSFLRSFAWVPVIGLVIGIVLGPRFVLAPWIELHEHAGVRASVTESMRRTKGLWGTIVLHLLVAALLGFFAANILRSAAAATFGPWSLPAVLVWTAATQMAGAYVTAVVVELSRRMAKAR